MPPDGGVTQSPELPPDGAFLFLDLGLAGFRVESELSFVNAVSLPSIVSLSASTNETFCNLSGLIF